jgi:hypothetical protein
MADLSKLSDDDLRKMYGQQTSLESMPDAQLIALHKQSSNADANLGGTLQLGVPFTGARFDTGLKMSPAMEAGLVGAGKTTQRLIQGIRQAMPGDNSAVDTQVAQENTAYDPLAKAHPVATTIGEIAPYMVTGNPLAMAGMSAAEYGTPGERAARAGLAYGGAKLGQGVARLFGPQSMSPVASTAGDFVSSPLNAGNKWGIPLRMAQTTDSKPIQIMDAVAANLPVSSGVIAKAKDASFQGFNRAASKTFGEDTSKITPEILGNAMERSGKQIGNVMEQASAQLGPQHMPRISELSNVIADLGSEGGVLNDKLSKVIEGMTNGNSMGGKSLRMLDSSLGRLMGSTNGDVRYAAANLQNIVRDAATESLSKENAALLKAARAENFNVRQVADASKGGVLSPSQLLTQVNKYQRKARYGGGNDLADLAQWAKPVLGDTIPNSGTAQRAWYQNLMTNPLTTIGTAGGALYGGNELGVSPLDAGAGLLGTYAAARGMAGKPASELMKRMLMQGGGLLGISASP